MQNSVASKTAEPPFFEKWAAAADALTRAFERVLAGAAGASEDVKRLSEELQTLNHQSKEPRLPH